MSKYIRKIAILCVLFMAQYAFAQGKYWIMFTDKDMEHYRYDENISERTIRNRINQNLPLWQYSDIPVRGAYVDSLRKMGVEAQARSKWLNAVSATLTKEQIESVSTLPYVDRLEPIVERLLLASVDMELNTKKYSQTLKQMNAAAFVKAGLSGMNVSVGVIDAGFFNAHNEPGLKHLFMEDRIRAQKDFVTPNRTDLIESLITTSDGHGQRVLDYLAGYNPSDHFQSGLGVNAFFYLARTENGDKEHRIEEDNWIMAMEWMDSLGVQLVNTSLGYAQSMDDPEENYKKEEMNGQTARITRAAQMAVDEKGMFMVVSAGNEGGNANWRIISAPADAQGVLSIGATASDQMTRIWYSSVGPDFLPYLKPNVSAFSPNGTSFSAPAVTGFVACLLQKDSTLTPRKLMSIMEKSAHLYPYGNNFIGYGVPQADRALALLADSAATFGNNQIVADRDRVELVFREADKKDKAVVFHKRNARDVIRQDVVPIRKRRLIVERQPGEKATTVNVGLKTIEVIWED